MEKRGLKTRKTLSNAIDKRCWDGLDSLHKETRIPKSRLLDEAIWDLLKKYKKGERT